jgi:hypothetical protein
MTIEASILQQLQDDGAVGALAADRIYAGAFPEGITLPAVSFFRVGTDPIMYLDGTRDTLLQAKFEVIAWAEDYATAKDLADAIRDALVGSTAFRASWTNQSDQYNDTPPVYFVVQEFNISQPEDT